MDLFRSACICFAEWTQEETAVFAGKFMLCSRIHTLAGTVMLAFRHSRLCFRTIAVELLFRLLRNLDVF